MTRLLALARRWWPAAALAAGLALLAVARCPRPARETTRRDAAAVVRAVGVAQETRATVRRETRTETRPDGGRVVTVVRERTDVAARATTATDARARERVVTVTERVRASWRAELRAGWQRDDVGAALRALPPVLDVSLSRRVLGPGWVGAWARRDGGEYAAGLSLAVEW